MPQVSVVIIAKNEAYHIAACIDTAKKISDDIIVVDTGSTDATIALAKAQHVRVRSVAWEGYGEARNTGAAMAAHDWIFSLDADERITNRFASEIKRIALSDQSILYGFKRINYFGGRRIQYGSFAHDRVVRLYNRRGASWNKVPVHEKLAGSNTKKIMTGACFIHFTAQSEADYRQKITRYAFLCALKYQQEAKRFILIRRFFSPVFGFIKDYIFQLGFLDRRPGFTIASLHAFYTRKKYQYLLELLGEEKSRLHPAGRYHSFRRIRSFLS